MERQGSGGERKWLVGAAVPGFFALETPKFHVVANSSLRVFVRRQNFANVGFSHSTVKSSRSLLSDRGLDSRNSHKIEGARR